MMALFGGRKEAREKCCGNMGTKSTKQAQAVQGGSAAVKVLGSGCKKCNELEANVKAALGELGMDATIEHVTDFAAIAAYGAMSTPALVLGEKLVSAGKVLKKNEAIELIKKHPAI